MARASYSREVCRELIRRASDPSLLMPYQPSRYEAGDVLDLEYTTVWPEERGRGLFVIEKFVGGGFAGQVYRCRVQQLQAPFPAANGGLAEGAACAVKMMIPPTRFSRAFRNALYWLGFQGPFSAQVNEGACRGGLLWQRLAQRAMERETGDPLAVAAVYASFYDPRQRAYGEIREWVEGRTWLLEPDTRPGRRRRWRTLDLAETESPEYVAKRRFMDRFVRLLREMGAPELARQYQWWTMKSQPNVLKRSGAAGPAAGLCAVDFRAGLALLPFLPMSPADVRLIFDGIFRRASLVQFDRCDFEKLRHYVSKDESARADLMPIVEALETYDRAYRRSLPDLSRRGLRLLFDRGLRADVRRGLAEGYLAAGVADEAFAAALRGGGARFAAFYLLGGLPLAGRFARRLWGCAAYRRHLGALLTRLRYFQASARAGMAATLVQWLRAGRVGDGRARFLAEAPALYWLQRLTLGFLPAGLHRAVAEPSFVWQGLLSWVRFTRDFYRDPDFREKWFIDQVRQGREEGMLDEAECQAILSKVRDPFIARYLKCMGVHFATLPVSEIFWTLVAGVVAVWTHATGGDVKEALAKLAGAVIVVPVSPGSLVRGFYVIYLMIREKNVRDYVVAGPFSFLKILGYLAFPIQMVTIYPVLARFLASQWATATVNVIPVFGEKGALLEHFVFDAFFNAPRMLGRWAGRRMKGILDAWLLAGLVLLGAIFGLTDLRWNERHGVDLILIVLVVFILPRVLFYPMLKGRWSKPRE